MWATSAVRDAETQPATAQTSNISSNREELLTVIALSSRWATELASKPETGMGYQVVSVILKDGGRFDQVAVVEGQIGEIRGHKDIPFTEDQIVQIVLTHDKWNFNAER